MDKRYIRSNIAGGKQMTNNMKLPVFLVTIALLSGLSLWAVSKHHLIVAWIFIIILIGFVRSLWRM